MNSRTKVRSVRGWDIGLAAAILAAVLLGWLTAAGGNRAAPHSGQLVSPAESYRQARPGGDVTGNFYVAPRPRCDRCDSLRPALPRR